MCALRSPSFGGEAGEAAGRAFEPAFERANRHVVAFVEQVLAHLARAVTAAVLDQPRTAHDVIAELRHGRADALGRREAGLATGALHGVRTISSEEHTSELQSLMRISYAGLCLKQKKT